MWPDGAVHCIHQSFAKKIGGARREPLPTLSDHHATDRVFVQPHGPLLRHALEVVCALPAVREQKRGDHVQHRACNDGHNQIARRLWEGAREESGERRR